MRSLLSVILLLFTLTIFCQSVPCSNFKTGEFKYSNPKYSEWTITRTDSTQIEISSKTGIEIYSSVKWKSVCEYILACEKILNSDSKNGVGKVFEISIIETFSDRYKCISKKNDIQMVDLELEMIKLK